MQMWLTFKRLCRNGKKPPKINQLLRMLIANENVYFYEELMHMYLCYNLLTSPF